MSHAVSDAVEVPPPTPAWTMYRALVGVSVLCGFIIVGVYEWTRPYIERNRAKALERAVFRVLPGAHSSRSYIWSEEEDAFRVDEGSRELPVVHAGYDAKGNLIGVAVAAKGMGYQDGISVLFGYAPRKQAIIGLAVLESRETPGLGDKIETDPAFRANFEHLDVTLDVSGTALENPIELVASGAKSQPWQIDSITGATISSQAIASILAGSAAEWVPRVHGSEASFEEEGRP